MSSFKVRDRVWATVLPPTPRLREGDNDGLGCPASASLGSASLGSDVILDIRGYGGTTPGGNQEHYDNRAHVCTKHVVK